ncbi:MAG: hypothetical protein ACOYLB_08475 [Phototrophicaceae bacterium]
MVAADMPDFDNMSPEEMFRWMETLAKRQGVKDEELLTAADATVAEVDHTNVKIDEPGYIPYGKTEPVKPNIPAPKEPAKVVEPPAPPPPPPPPVAVKEPEPEEVDFDNMTAEQALRWMETLAKRQGVKDEELLTSADASIAYVDASTAKIDEPGYIPYGKTEPVKPKPTPPPPPPAPKASVSSLLDELAGEDEGQNVLSFLNIEPEDTSRAIPTPTLSRSAPSILDELDQADAGLPDLFNQLTANEANDLSWMDALSTANTGNQFLSLDDLDALTADLDDNLFNISFNPPAPTPPPPPATAVLDALDQFDQAPKPSSKVAVNNPLEDGTDPLTWLENIARRKGVPEEELITKTRFDVPVPKNVDAREFEPGYKAYSVDDEGMESEPLEPLETESEMFLDATDPSAWFSGSDRVAFAAIEAEEEVDTEESLLARNRATLQPTSPSIEDMLNQGITPAPKDMQAWMSHKLDELVNSEPLPLGVETQQATDEASETEMPDWLKEIAPIPTVETTKRTRFELPDLGAPTELDLATDEVIPEDLTDLFGERRMIDDNDRAFSTKGLSSPSELYLIETGDDEEDALTHEIFTMSEPSLNDSILENLREGKGELDEFVTPQMPSWLQEDALAEEESIRAIFDTSVNDTIPPLRQTRPLDPELLKRFDPRQTQAVADPWVDALDQEQHNETDLRTWYDERRKNFEATLLTLAEPTFPIEATLALADYDEALPVWFKPHGIDLDVSEVQETAAVPEWITEDLDMVEPQEALPDWLAGAELGTSSDVPDWLLDSGEQPAIDVSLFEPEPVQVIAKPQAVVIEATPIVAPTQAVIPAPKPVVLAVAHNIAQALQQAQQYQQQGEVASALQTYETVIRANQELDQVVNAVQKIISSNQNNTTAHRVLGDALMRQGKLQAALDTYRRALNLL